MKERPILFSGEMVRAILSGRKTMTRRVMKPSWSRCLDLDDAEDRATAVEQCPYGEPGDRLWVRSGWSVTYNESRHQTWWSGPEGTGLSFVTHGLPEKPKRLGNQPSIHMPRWVAQNLRLPVLEVTDVRVERVQDISEADAVAEGFERREHFIRLWDDLNAKRGFGFDSNPWVWCVSFRRSEP